MSTRGIRGLPNWSPFSNHISTTNSAFDYVADYIRQQELFRLSSPKTETIIIATIPARTFRY